MNQRFLHCFKRSENLICLFIILAAVIFALFPSFFCKYDPHTADMGMRLLPISFDHWLGTDKVGHDIWTRVVYGARTSVMILISVLLLSAPLGATLGLVAGLAQGVVKRIVMRITEIAFSLPRLVVAMMLPALLGTGGWVVSIFAIAVTSWPVYTRLTCLETERVRQEMFVHVAKLQGAGALYIMRKHILPMILPSVIIRMSLDGSSVLLISAALSFLGLGISPEVVEWGAMASEGSALLLTFPLAALVPGCVIGLLSYAFNILGDALRDLLDPKQEV